MKTPLAWKNIVHNKVRTAVGVAGVGFAVILIFMQMGFKGAVRKTATQIYDALDFDLMLRSPAYLHLTEPQSFPRQRVFEAASLPGVAKARPFYLGLSEWQRPQPADAPPGGWQGDWRGIIAMGVDPRDPPFVPTALRRESLRLTDARFVLIDNKSKPEFGPANGVRFGPQDVGVETILGSGRVRIVGVITLGTGLAANGACVANVEGFARACPWQAIDEVNFGLLSLASGVDPATAKREIQSLLGAPTTSSVPSAQPADVEVLTRAEVVEREEYRWVVETPLGQIFNFGVWVALFVGVAIVYQVLSADIANMMSEYATLKAMGYPNRYLAAVVLEQSVLLALVGYEPSLAVSWGLYLLVGGRSGLPMILTWQIAATVLALAVLMCALSGLAALRKLFQADPADLF
ncbi:MAG: FtsX-like permease family protein [Pirellulales bacterium]|nr:FtsX-like permease family protein [Pirellulales bacterium]